MELTERKSLSKSAIRMPIHRRWGHIAGNQIVWQYDNNDLFMIQCEKGRDGIHGADPE